MANDLVIITYQHFCGCSRHGEQVHVHPRCDNGVAYLEAPECIERSTRLVEVSRQSLSAEEA